MTATKTETAKTAHDYFQASNTAMKEGIEKSIAAMYEMNAYSKKNLEAVLASMTAATKGAESVGARAIAFSKKSVENQIAANKALTGAKTQDVLKGVEAKTRQLKQAMMQELLTGRIRLVQPGLSGEPVSKSVKASEKGEPSHNRAITETVVTAKLTRQHGLLT